jgi:hypothetical protein
MAGYSIGESEISPLKCFSSLSGEMFRLFRVIREVGIKLSLCISPRIDQECQLLSDNRNEIQGMKLPILLNCIAVDAWIVYSFHRVFFVDMSW